jgi:hypothetical protein
MLATFGRLADNFPGNPEWQHHLSVAYEKIGDAFVVQRKAEEALNAFQTSATIRQKLAEAERGNAERQRDLSNGYEKMAGLLNGNQRATALQRSLAIREVLAAGDQGNAGLQSELVVTLYNLSLGYDATAARPLLKKALAILDKLESEQKLTEEQRFWPKFVGDKLAELP